MSEFYISDKNFNYQMLDRLKQDCLYFLGNGNRSLKYLHQGSVEKQIEYMKALYNSFSEEDKPEWITLKDIENFESQMKETKKITNERLLLFLDSKGMTEEEWLNRENPSNFPYISFIDGMVADYEKIVGNTDGRILDQEDFSNFIKYKVLDKKIEEIARNTIGIGHIDSSFEAVKLLRKYNIEKESDPDKLYIRLKDSFERGIRKKIKEQYEKNIEMIIPDKYKEKYLPIIGFDKERDNFKNYSTLSDNIKIAQNIEKLESIPKQVKFFIQSSESSFFKSGEIWTLTRMRAKYDRAKTEFDSEIKDGVRTAGTYDKVKMNLILDKVNDVIISDGLRCDIPDWKNFDEFLDKTIKREIINEYIKPDRDINEQIEEIEDDEESEI